MDHDTSTLGSPFEADQPGRGRWVKVEFLALVEGDIPEAATFPHKAVTIANAYTFQHVDCLTITELGRA